MERKTYLGRYQVSIDERGEPMALDRTASSVTLKAEDTTSGEPVAVQIVRPGPLEEVPREKVEAEARAAQQLDHVNIARARDFGFEGADLVYVREFLEGSTLDAWVREHGPLPVAAVMRIALQGVNALAAAAFQSVPHRALQPSSMMIVPGQTPEGDWPLVKILNFGAPAPIFSRNGFTTSGPGELAQFASPEQLQGAPADFKSDIYALGATLWFLLTGTPPRAGGLQRSRGIPKNVAAIVSRMVAANPEQRPHDPLVLQEEIRDCLGRVERRDSIGRRFGLPAAVAKPDAPLVAAGAAPFVVASPGAVPSPGETLVAEEAPEADEPVSAGPESVGRFLGRPLAWAAALLALGMIGAMILPGAVRSVRTWQAERAPDEIGVKVGVPDSAANAVAAVPAASMPPGSTTEPQAAAPAAPEVSPPQETAVAVNRAAPATEASPNFPSAGEPTATNTQQSPQVVAAASPTTSLPATASNNDAAVSNPRTAQPQSAAPAMAYMNNGGVTPPADSAPATQSPQGTESSSRQQQASTSPSSSRAPVVAANAVRPAEPVTDPAAPAEGPAATQQSRSTAQRDSQAPPPPARSAAPKTASASAEVERKPTPPPASTSPSRAKTANRRLSAREQTELEVRQALPISPEEEAALPPVPRGSQRARYLGTTPDGALVFGMPSAERVYVAPQAPNTSRRRSRRAPADAPPPRAEPVLPEELAAPVPDDDEE